MTRLSRSRALSRLTLLLVGSLIVTAGAVATAAPNPSREKGRSAARDGVPHMPLRFELNRGQTHPRFDAVARADGYIAFFQSTGITLRVAAEGDPSRLVQLRLVGADPQARFAAQEQLRGRSHYLKGAAKDWIVDVPGYARIRYADIYPGIDVLYRASDRQLEYVFVVAPGADPSSIALDLQGADAVALEGADLRLDLPAGWLRQPQPTLYQEVEGRRVQVEGGYVLNGRRLRFAVGPHDPDLPLVIDPSLGYSTFLGGSSIDFSEDVAVDAAGNAYVTGETQSADFPDTPGAWDGTLAAVSDAFVAKFDSTGQVVYATYLGGNDTDHGRGIAVDATGNAYVVGSTRSTAGFPLVNPFQSSKESGFTDAFVTKLDPAGSAIVFSTYLGGNEDDVPFAVAVDASGQAYVAGFTDSPRVGVVPLVPFPTTAGVVQPSSAGGRDAFVTKFAASGATLVYSTHLGGLEEDEARDMVVDGSGQAYVVGDTRSLNFPTAAALDPTFNGVLDAFVAKLNASGSALVYSTYHGGSQEEEALGVATDAGGNAYVTGYTSSNAATFPITAGTFQTARAGGMDAFVSKLNPAGSALVYSTYFGGTSDDIGYAVAVNGAGKPFLTGSTLSTDLPVRVAFQPTYGGTKDAFVAGLNAEGNVRTFGSYLGGTAGEAAGGVALDAHGNAVLVGSTGSAANFPTANAEQPTYGGGTEDGFVSKIDDVNIDVVYRFFHTPSSKFFYTISEPEKNAVLAMAGWQFEDVRWRAWHFNTSEVPSYTKPLYRFFRPASTSHFFTTSDQERDDIINNLPDWDYEGTGFRVIPFNHTPLPAGVVPVYRYFSSQTTGHFWTTSQSEAPAGYTLEGIAFYVYPS